MGNDTEGYHYGCQVVTAEVFEIDENRRLSLRAGSMHLNNVEIFNCSTRTKPSVNFHNLVSKESSMNNCSIHSGMGKGGILVNRSSSVTVKDNFVLDH
jgi:hypothetical protein